MTATTSSGGTTRTEAPRYGRHPRGTHRLLLEVIRRNSNVLDVGCSTGYLGQALVEQGCRVWGLDHDPDAVESARAFYEDARTIDLEAVESLPWPEQSFDVLLAADVLEHLRDPSSVLTMLLRYLRQDGLAVISLPNVAHASVRIPLFFGRFTYTGTGILDETHFRLFTFQSAQVLAESCGLEVQDVLIGSDRFGPLLNRWRRIGRLLRGLLAYNIVLLARPVP